MQSQFKIEAWQFHQTLAPLSHKHQIKALQQIITKSKAVRRPLKLKSQRKYDQTEQRSIVNLKEKRKKHYTEQIYSNDLSAEFSNQAKQTYLNNILTISQHSMPYPQIFSKIYRLRQGQSCNSQAGIISRKQGVQHFKTIKRRSKQKATANINMNQKRDSKVISENSNIKRYQNNVNSNQQIVVIPNFKEKVQRRAKSFFVQTIEDKLNTDQRNKRNKIKLTNQKVQLVSDHFSRRKQLVQKPTRRKKQIEQSLKARSFYGKKQVQKRIRASNLAKMLSQQSKKAILQRMDNNQFNDDSLYCLWSYRQQRLVQHLKGKKIQ